MLAIRIILHLDHSFRSLPFVIADHRRLVLVLLFFGESDILTTTFGIERFPTGTHFPSQFDESNFPVYLAMRTFFLFIGYKRPAHYHRS